MPWEAIGRGAIRKIGGDSDDVEFSRYEAYPTEERVAVMADALNVHEITGFLPSQLAAELIRLQDLIDAASVELKGLYDCGELSGGWEALGALGAYEPNSGTGEIRK